MEAADARIEIVLPGSLRGADAAEAVAIFAGAFEFADVAVVESKKRSLLESTEPPLQFTIEILSNPWVQSIGGSIIGSIIMGRAKATSSAIVDLYKRLAKRFPGRRIQIMLRIPKMNAPTPSYPLSSKRVEISKQIDGIAVDIESGKGLHGGIRLWYEDGWMSSEEYFAARRAETESEGPH